MHRGSVRESSGKSAHEALAEARLREEYKNVDDHDCDYDHDDEPHKHLTLISSAPAEGQRRMRRLVRLHSIKLQPSIDVGNIGVLKCAVFINDNIH